MRCLIVDDSASFRAAVVGMLERGGIAVVGTASNSSEALACCADLRPDVVLVDVDLGLESGFDLAEQLHVAGLPPVILMSAHSEQDFAELIAASPAVGFLSKIGLSPDAVVNLVDSHSNSNPSVSAPRER